MARIRTIKPEFWADEKLSPMDDSTRLLFLALISMADDCGRLLDSVPQIVAFMYPYLDDVAFANRSRILRESLAKLSEAGRIVRGTTASGQRVVQIANWEKHQKVDHPNTRAALPEIVEVTPLPEIRESLANDSREIREEFATDSRDDLRSTIYDQRPTTSDPLPKRARKPRASAPVENEVAVLGDWWTETFGAIEYGSLGRWSKPIRARYPLAQIQEAAKVYNSDDEGPRGFRSPQHFFQTFVKWHQIAQTPPVDGDGNFTARGKRIMGAA